MERTGLGEEILSVDAIEAIYMTCAFETSWDPSKASPWCHLFDEEDLGIMQYRQDIEYYWVDGYGHELTYKQACPAIKDLVNYLQYAINFRTVTDFL
jgi:multiple inositol-polyphosphate phosphatase/2,3-bisphosphoglycerate 3-phosphatase